MAQITFNIPDAVVSRVREAFASEFHYEPFTDDGPNPETLTAFTKRMIIQNFIMPIVREYEARTAVTTARSTSIAQTNSDIVIT